MFKRLFWKDHVEGVQEGTDLNADNLNNMEGGIEDAAALAALNSSFNAYFNSSFNALKNEFQNFAGSILPYRENLNASGGYCADMDSEKEWAVKPDSNVRAEYRTMDRFAGYPVYEFDVIMPTSTQNKTYTISVDASEEKLLGAKYTFFLIGCVGAYQKNNTTWAPIDDGVLSISVASVDVGDSHGTLKYEMTVKSADSIPGMPRHAIRLRYIFIKS